MFESLIDDTTAATNASTESDTHTVSPTAKLERVKSRLADLPSAYSAILGRILNKKSFDANSYYNSALPYMV